MSPTHEAAATCIFDLDGTLSDPAVGIGRSINYALAAAGHCGIGDAEVSRCIGPPLDRVFRRIVPEASDDAVLAMVAKYRERYLDLGYAENVLYPGIPEALEHLASRGVPMGVCTSKRGDIAERVLALFRLRPYFTFVSGGDVGLEKRDRLRILLESGMAGRASTMVGDRGDDVSAARANGLRSAGVLWGFGSRTELVAAAPDRLLERPGDLHHLA
jgi:phosphoglycolate phosphatase